MKYLFYAFVMLSVLLHLAPVSAQDTKNKVIANVTLSPLGSFELTSVRVFGKAQKKGTAFIAKEIRVPVNMLRTGMGLRDKHLRDKLEAETHKNIVAKNLKVKDGKGQGLITIKGVTKPLQFNVKDLGDKQAEAKFQINLKDFGISGINYQGVGVKDTVDVTAIIPYDEV